MPMSRRQLAGRTELSYRCHGARRGTYRIVYRIEEANHTVHVLDIDHRAEIYRPHS